ncbi:hypothetical protein AXG93_3052s1000 [Marchantia polymorpha subsp. ruderalis]|uniref:Uncharacterized protein n=1 Tax=Marchantia polymorpha subsp. ruderalis TaxID=1480154 RepID=A0A176WI16_MARPO|nr:hypothetical protein AXG93_3052s1000 [Marchantia polymorpha subsp. ruderalis]
MSWARSKASRESSQGEERIDKEEALPYKRPVDSCRTVAGEVLTVSSNTEENPVALEEVAAKAVEDVAATESGLQKVISPQTSTYTVILEMDEEASADESQSPVLGAADLLSVQVLPLLK